MPPTLLPRELSTGAKAGASIGGAAACLVLIAVLVFLAVAYRRRHLPSISSSAPAPHSRSRGGEKSGTSTPRGVNGSASGARPNEYRRGGAKGRGDDGLKKPEQATLKDLRAQEQTEGVPHWEEEMGRPLVHKPWLNGSRLSIGSRGSRISFSPSFSSKRATRMMMFM